MPDTVSDSALLDAFTKRFGNAEIVFRRRIGTDGYTGYAFLLCHSVQQRDMTLATLTRGRGSELVVQEHTLYVTRRQKTGPGTGGWYLRDRRNRHGALDARISGPRRQLSINQRVMQAQTAGSGRGSISRPARIEQSIAGASEAEQLQAVVHSAKQRKSPLKQQQRQTNTQCNHDAKQAESRHAEEEPAVVRCKSGPLLPMRIIYHSTLIIVNNLP